MTEARQTFIDEDGIEVVIVEAHWCMMMRVFRGFQQPDACPVCLRPFPDTPWDPENSPPSPEPEWVSVGVTFHDTEPFLRHRILPTE